MQLIKQAIQNNQLARAGLIASQHIVGAQKDICTCLRKVERWAKQARVMAHISQPDQAAFERLIQFFYRDLAFSGSHLRGEVSPYEVERQSVLHQVLDYRSGTPVTLGIVFSSVAQHLGFKVACVNFPGHFLLRCDITPPEVEATLQNGAVSSQQCNIEAYSDSPVVSTSLFIDPNDGRILSQEILEQMYFEVIEEIDDETMPKEALETASCDEVVVHMLNQLKASLINAKRYEEALRSIELLIALCPNNPYERRDRGVLLHELACPQLAIIDYQYFIRQCPDDPAATLLAQQVKHMNITPPVMH
ncbi:hypothetical protein GMES_0049 [Paraglaciecola mesophila KMM 241]|uniref:Protein SirB1 N-terminal domain-containing protein n=1 Tax=Paraglaciecola mesophila KMM 241 TaxID=1128912 RepID=K6XP05_9ALTE|nr:tetratricopeptide repeat protein [Paraglaciecola mesophila]GAC22359.1 hypothetical protein GMES_0049 [Paraglaciecola mesophila KMM 241]